MASRFSSQIPLSNLAATLLPVFHTCDGHDARSHIERRNIVTDDVCEVFGEKITYLFYGRPAYKFETVKGATTDLSFYPVCFVFDVSRISSITKIFPFDTGAFFHRRMQKHINPKSTLLDFELEPLTSRISDVVVHFFGSNEKYQKASIERTSFDPFDFESISYAEMTRSHGISDADERRVTMELHAPSTLSLGDGSLTAVILPTALRDSAFFRQFVDENSLEVQSYDVEVWDPSQSFGLVSAAAKRLMIRRGSPHP